MKTKTTLSRKASPRRPSRQDAAGKTSQKQPRPLSDSEYKALSDFRYQLRRYLRFMEDHARSAGFQPQQYQLLLAIKGLPEGKLPSVSILAERMQLNHNTLVELAERCEQHGWITRTRSVSDRRQVTLAITPHGEIVLRQQASASRQELRTIGPILSQSLQKLIAGVRLRKKT